MYISAHDVKHRTNRRPHNVRANQIVGRSVWVACIAHSVLLLFANRAFTHRAGRHMACRAGPLRRVPTRDIGRSWSCSRLGMVSHMAEMEMRVSKADNTLRSGVRFGLIFNRCKRSTLGRRCNTCDVCDLERTAMKNWLLTLGIGGSCTAAVC